MTATQQTTGVKTECPYCHYEIVGATATDKDAPRSPQQGDPAICIRCGEISEFDGALQLVKPTPERLARHRADPEVRIGLLAWKAIEPARKARGW